MKKSIKIIAIAVAALMLCLSLTSCFGKKLDGKYECEGALFGEYTMEFEGDNVTLKRKNLLGSIDKWEGTYKIDDDTIEFTFVDDDGDEIEDAPFAGEWEFDEDEDSGDITIGEYGFEKVD